MGELQTLVFLSLNPSICILTAAESTLYYTHTSLAVLHPKLQVPSLVQSTSLRDMYFRFGPFRISLEEISFGGRFSDSFPEDSIKQLISQEPYQDLEYYGGEEEIIKTRAQRLRKVEGVFTRTFWSFTAYIVPLQHDDSKMKNIKTRHIEKGKEI
jgi:hypothetical protein